MKFIYLIEWNCNGLTGVERKIKSQMNVWREMGHDVTAVIVGRHFIKDRNILEREDFDFWSVPELPLLKSKLGAQLIKQFYFICIWFKYFLAGNSFVYYRVSTLSLAIIFCFRYKMVLDINSIDSEARSGLKKILAPFSHLYRYILFKSAFFSCFITDELLKYYSEKYPVIKSATCVLGNGYFNSDFTDKQIEDYFYSRDNKKRQRPCLLFIGFGSDNHYWHGYDKFRSMVAQLPEYDFIIVGESKNNDCIPGNLKIIKKMYKENILEIFKQADIGIGTLALHRANMNEASPLKVAEYIYLGLPVITAYKDVNISGKDFNLELNNTEDNINESSLSRIRKFVQLYAGYTLNEQERECVSFLKIEKKRMYEIGKFIKK